MLLPSHWLVPALITVALSLVVRAAQNVVIDATDSRVVYVPSSGQMRWLSQSLAGCGEEGVYMCSYSSDAEFTVTFVGIAFSMNFMKFANGARALIEVDGVAQTTVDTFSALQQCTVQVFSMPNLQNGTHRVRVADATRNITARGLVFKSLTYNELDVTTSPAASQSTAYPSTVITTTAPPPTSTQSSDKVSIGLIAGASAGGGIALFLLVAIVWFLMRQRRPPAQPLNDTAINQPNIRNSAGTALIERWVPGEHPGHPVPPAPPVMTQTIGPNEGHFNHQRVSFVGYPGPQGTLPHPHQSYPYPVPTSPPQRALSPTSMRSSSVPLSPGRNETMSPTLTTSSRPDDELSTNVNTKDPSFDDNPPPPAYIP